jgi:hypothetical protein
MRWQLHYQLFDLGDSNSHIAWLALSFWRLKGLRIRSCSASVCANDHNGKKVAGLSPLPSISMAAELFLSASERSSDLSRAYRARSLDRSEVLGLKAIRVMTFVHPFQS